MKRLILLLVVAIAAITLSSPLFASSPSNTSPRYDKIMIYIYQYLFPITGKYLAPVGPLFIDSRDNDGGRLGGDADDYANGKDKDLIGGNRNKKTNLSSGSATFGAKTGSDGSIILKAGRR